jgi:DNA-binding CsgD family transcriptional regulator
VGTLIGVHPWSVPGTLDLAHLLQLGSGPISSYDWPLNSYDQKLSTIMQTLTRFSAQLASLIPTVGSPQFPGQFIGLLKQLVQIDDATIIVYPGLGMPVVQYFEEPEGAGNSTLDVYLKGAFLLDPYYLAAAEGRQFGVFRLRELAPEEFKDSDYYQNWYRNCGYHDECGYLIANGEEGFINIALGRLQGSDPFSDADLEILQAVRPTIDTLCRQHWAGADSDASAINLRARLHAALNAFGSSLLTERETQVINLVLHGHSTKTLAEKLSISMETVKLHRKHAYAKLEVSSQAELFYLFLDSVMSAGNHDDGDPLVSYLRPGGSVARPPGD